MSDDFDQIPNDKAKDASSSTNPGGSRSLSEVPAISKPAKKSAGDKKADEKKRSQSKSKSKSEKFKDDKKKPVQEGEDSKVFSQEEGGKEKPKFVKEMEKGKKEREKSSKGGQSERKRRSSVKSRKDDDQIQEQSSQRSSKKSRGSKKRPNKKDDRLKIDMNQDKIPRGSSTQQMKRENPVEEFEDDQDKIEEEMKQKSRNLKYISRRTKNYDDSDSQGEGDCNLTTGVIQYKDTKGNILSIKPNIRFKPYQRIFMNLNVTKSVVTKYPLISMSISYDSTRAITVSKANEFASYINMYDLNTNEMTFEEKIDGRQEQKTCIKVKEVEQNNCGNCYAVVFLDDGKFKLRTFGKTSRTQEEIAANELNINELLGINDYTMANTDFPDPFITCCFIDDDRIFVNFFYNYSLTHYHFIWHVKKRQIQGKPVKGKPDEAVTHVIHQCNMKNFPYKSFYNDDKDEIYSFYRQGQAFCIKPSDLENFRFEQMTDLDLGQMMLIYNECLVARSSSRVLFFKQELDKVLNMKKWVLFKVIKVRGMIFYIKGNIRIQITTDQFIYFYLIDQETFEPTLENVMQNYMGCNQMMFGKRVRYGVTFKSNQKSFEIYTRKCMHNLKVCVQNQNLEGAIAVELTKHKVFLVSKIDKVMMFDSENFKEVGSIPITLLITETREPNQVIGITYSHDQKMLAIISGKNLIMGEQKQNQCFVFQLKEGQSNLEYPKFELHKRIVVKDIPIFKKVSMQYHFKKTTFGQQPETIIFAKYDEIFELNFETDDITTLYKYNVPLSGQPEFFVSNPDQDIFMIASENYSLYINTKTGQELDLDHKFGVTNVKQVVYEVEDGQFYFVANKYNGIIGFFLIAFSIYDPDDFKFLTMWRQKLEISNVSLNVLRGDDKESGRFKELIIGYKTIYINTYTVVVQDLSGDESKRATLQKHESYQLWESQIQGLLLARTRDFLSFSKAGINVLALGTTPKRMLIDNEGQKKMIHSLDSLSFLKVDELNYLNFKCQDYNNRVVSIEQEWKKNQGTDDVDFFYDEIYKVKIHEITLRELLILQSFYVCNSQSDIVNLVKMQPNPSFFYKTFLELDGSNMVAMLAFDSGSMKSLLSDDNKHLFNSDFPIMYKSKVQKRDGKSYYYTNAIDFALKNNQVGAVNVMIEYIIKFQNNYVTSYLFLKNLPILLEKSINVAALLESNVFNHTFDFDDWPANHWNEEECIRPYFGSFFQIRHSYKTVFPEKEFDLMGDSKEGDKKEPSAQGDNQKVFKVKYSINLLQQVGFHMIRDFNGDLQFVNEDVELAQIASEAEEDDMFYQPSLQQVLQYKWNTYGKYHHVFGLIMHLFYVIVIIVYTNTTYINESSNQLLYGIMLAIGVIYPFFYESIQAFRTGPEYLTDAWNYADLMYIWGSAVNIVLQNVLGPFNIVCRILMCIIVTLLIIKTFFFLRIFPLLTPIVVMITSVIYDLRIFLTFYTILLVGFCQLFAVIGLGNLDVTPEARACKADPTQCPEEEEEEFEEGDERLLRFLKPKGGGGGGDTDDPAKEYFAVGLHWAELIWTLRVSLGDNALIEAAKQLDKGENIMFWVCWYIVAIITCVIFLNFIVAEASNSYNNVVETLEPIMWREKSALIAECEDMTMNRFKNQHKFPKYLIARELD